MSSAINLRQTARLDRVANEIWQININNDELITRNIINLCPGGVAIKTPQRVKFQIGQWLHLQISLSQDASFECEAKVVWVKDQSYGLQFFKIPMAFDAFIMRSIHESRVVLNRPDDKEFVTAGPKDYRFTATLLRQSHRTLERRSVLSSVWSLFIVGIMAAAIVSAAMIHQQKHPEFKLAKILEQAFIAKMNK